jgi:branched-chain amino acid transport system ATP-binding protein
MAFLEVKGLSSGYGEVQILWDISFSVEKGKLTAVIGPNGAGKTTLLRSIMGLVKPWKGSILLDGEDITRLPPHKKVEKGLVLIPEGRQIFPEMTVLENLEMGAFTSRASKHFQENLEKVFDLFPRLKERIKQKAGTLSGGEQQMLAIARGLMSGPQILMLDEPSLGLAPYLVLLLFDVIRRLRNEGVTMVLVEQNTHLSLAISDYAYVLSNGRIEIEGEAREVMKIDSVKKAYLGM